MAYDDIIDHKQGAIKSSEIFLDRSLEIIKNSIGETLLKTLEGMMKPVSDALRYNNFLLHSDGQMIWETDLGQPRLRFDADAKANNVRLRLMMLDEAAVSRTVDIIIPGTVGANSLTAFNTINMNNNDLVYMELSRSVILAALSGTPLTTPAEIYLENGIDGGSIASGQRVLKVNTTGATGMPAMVADLDSVLQDASQTVNIPIASRFDWTDGISTYSDVWWIPHGIRWPTGSISVVGAVVVSGFDALPNYFVRTETELTQALTLLTADGGIITPIESFSISNPISIPANVTIYGRSNKATGIDNAKITIGTAANFTLAEGAKLKNLALVIPSGFGALGVAYVITLSGAGASVEDCEFKLESVTPLNLTNTRLVRLNAEKCFISRNNFFNATTAGATAVYIQSGTNHLVVHNRVTNVTEFGYVATTAAVNIRSDYGMVPVGSIIPWLGASYINASNSTPAYLVGGSGVANLTSFLGDGWTICDGRALPTDSPLRVGGNTFTPNLTNKFVRGASTFGASAGNNTYNINGATAAFNAGANVSGTALNSQNGTGAFPHQHNMSHVHQWGAYSALRFYAIQLPGGGINTSRWGFNAGGNTNGGVTNQILFDDIAGDGGANRLVVSGYNAAVATTNNDGQRWTAGPADANGSTANTGNPTGGNTFNVANNLGITQGSVSAASLNAAQSNHVHNLSSSEVLPEYMSVIFIMRTK